MTEKRGFIIVSLKVRLVRNSGPSARVGISETGADIISPQKWEHIRTPSTDVNELVEMLGWVFRKVDSRRQ